MTPEETAAILVGVAAVIGSLVSVYNAAANTRRIKDIDNAVNGRPKGSVTMQRQIADLHAERPFPSKEGIHGAAIREMVALLVEDMYERRAKEDS